MSSHVVRKPAIHRTRTVGRLVRWDAGRDKGCRVNYRHRADMTGRSAAETMRALGAEDEDGRDYEVTAGSRHAAGHPGGAARPRGIGSRVALPGLSGHNTAGVMPGFLPPLLRRAN